MAALATVSSHWLSSADPFWNCLSINCISNQETLKVHNSKFCKQYIELLRVLILKKKNKKIIYTSNIFVIIVLWSKLASEFIGLSG